MGPKGSQLPPPLRPPLPSRTPRRKEYFFDTRDFTIKKPWTCAIVEIGATHAGNVEKVHLYMVYWCLSLSLLLMVQKSGDHHLGCINPVNQMIFYHINWCRISSINRSIQDFDMGHGSSRWQNAATPNLYIQKMGFVLSPVPSIKKRVFSSSSYIHPGRLTAGTWEYTPKGRGKSSEPKHHFQVLC